MKNHVFLMLVHKEPSLFSRIIRKLEKENHYFIVNVDNKTTDFPQYLDAVKNLPNVFFLSDRINVYHGGMSMIYAELSLLREAMSHNIDYDYFHLISGQDYPLRSNELFDDFFENNDHSYMCFDYGEQKIVMEKLYKKFANHYHFPDSPSIWARLYKKFRIHYVLALFVHRKPIENYTGGWQWFSWHKSVAKYVLDYVDLNPRVLKRYEHTASPDEHLFPSILDNLCDKLKIEKQNPLRYVSWKAYRPVGTSYRPYDLSEEDYDRVINSKAFFCRKVDEKTSSRLLDMIDSSRDNEYDINEHNYYV